jgi:hypothetical protein
VSAGAAVVRTVRLPSRAGGAKAGGGGRKGAKTTKDANADASPPAAALAALALDNRPAPEVTEVLLIRRGPSRAFELPKGHVHVKAGESALAAAAREVRGGGRGGGGGGRGALYTRGGPPFSRTTNPLH